MKQLLIQLDTDPIPNTFDTVVAYDGGADHVIVHGGITPENVGKMVDGAVFTRASMSKKHTALFVAGSTMLEGEAVLDAITRHFYGNFRVSVMLDNGGGNTTAAAAIAMVTRHMEVAGRRAVVLAGTGPVGQRAAVILAREGAQVVLTSRRMERAGAVCNDLGQRFDVDIAPAVAADSSGIEAVMEGAELVVATGASGVELLAEEQWQAVAGLQMLVDANPTPPLGVVGVESTDKGTERRGKICYGALGFGGLKLELQRTCISKLFETNDQVLDVEEIFSLARILAKNR